MERSHSIPEVRQIREKLLEEAGGFKAYLKKLQKQEQEHPERLVVKKKYVINKAGAIPVSVSGDEGDIVI